MEGVETTVADADDRIGEATFEFEVCNLYDRRGVDGGSAASVCELRVRDRDNTDRFRGLEGRVGVGPVNAIWNATVPASSPAMDEDVSPPLKGNEVGLVRDSFMRLFVGVSGISPGCSKAEESQQLVSGMQPSTSSVPAPVPCLSRRI